MYEVVCGMVGGRENWWKKVGGFVDGGYGD